MTSLWRIFWLETVALWRGGTAALLLAASVGWLALLPRLLVYDGTTEGARQMYVRYGLGGVFVLLVVALLAAATGSVAAEREAKRLQLTLVRPVSGFLIAWGKFLALTSLGAMILALSAVVALGPAGTGRPCNHVYRPILETPREEAEKMYELYIADPETPPEIKKAGRATIVRILTQRARDRYDTIGTNVVESWSFPSFDGDGPLLARFRFTNTFDMRADVRGRVTFGEASGCLSNVTRTAVVVPLSGGSFRGDRLTFENTGSSALMLRPRQDVELLVPADGFAGNLTRAMLELLAVLALLIAFGVFLGAGLSRPVALFVAFVALTVGEMSPSVVDQYPDALESDRIDRIGLVLTRAVEKAARPIGSFAPLERLSNDDCVEGPEVLSALFFNVLLLPSVLALISGFLLSRKCE